MLEKYADSKDERCRKRREGNEDVRKAEAGTPCKDYMHATECVEREDMSKYRFRMLKIRSKKLMFII